MFVSEFNFIGTTSILGALSVSSNVIRVGYIMNAIQDFGDAIMVSLSGAMTMLFAAVPKILAFLAIIIVGWIIASLIASALASVMRAVSFNNLSRQSGFSDFLDNMGVSTDAAGFLGKVAKWFVRLLALIVAFDALGLPAVSEALEQLMLWLPNLIVAVVVLVIAGLAANALSSLVRGATASAGFDNPDVIATVARVSVWAFGIVVAVNQLGIATTLINTLFMATVGAVALALGLSFGLGGREAAASMIEDMRHKAKKAKGKAQDAVEAAKDRAKGQSTAAQLREVPGKAS